MSLQIVSNHSYVLLQLPKQEQLGQKDELARFLKLAYYKCRSQIIFGVMPKNKIIDLLSKTIYYIQTI